jgi:dTDP-4-dehydrorhamnose reductase
MILLIGSSGYIGSAMATCLTRHRLQFQSVSYTQCGSLARIIRDCNAEFLINCAGYTGKPNVDACELNREACYAGNVTLPLQIAQACDLCSIPWGHVSSGCIFSGSRANGTGFTETDEPNFCFESPPCSYYSGTKATAEQELLPYIDRLYQWRPRMPFNHIDSLRNYLSKLQRYDRLLNARNSITHLDEFAEACVQSWLRRIPFGTYNVVNSDSITTIEVVSMIKSILKSNKSFEFFANEDEFMQQAANAPRSNCILDNSKLLATGIAMRNVHDAIEESLLNWHSQ